MILRNKRFALYHNKKKTGDLQSLEKGKSYNFHGETIGTKRPSSKLNYTKVGPLRNFESQGTGPIIN